jgi:streptomycin 6-kinase
VINLAVKPITLEPPICDHVEVTESIALPAAYVDGMRQSMKQAAASWLAALPGHIEDVLVRWNLTVDGGQVRHGFAAVVLPVLTADGQEAVLKVGYQDAYTRTEVPALCVWGGRGAVRLLESDLSLDPAEDGGVGALLLERLDSDMSLHRIGDDEGAEITGNILAKLAAQPTTDEDLTGVMNLRDVAARWVDELPQAWSELDGPCDRHLLDVAVEVCRTLGPETHESLVHIDLHQANVLAGTREPWLAIDPQAMLADPAFCLVPFLRNRWKTVAEADNPHKALMCRFDILTETAGVDRERAAAWTLARTVEDLLYAARYGDNEGVSVPVATAIAEWMLPAT